MRGIFGRGLGLVILLAASAGQALGHHDLYSSLSSRLNLPNPFDGIAIPSRLELWAASPFRDRRIRPDGKKEFTPDECNSLLLRMKENFHRLRPNALDPASDIRVDVAWNVYVEMGPLRDLYWCRLQGRLRETVSRLDQSDFTPPPLPYRVDSKTYDYSKHHSWPIHIQTVRLIIADLAELSLNGHAPAMVALAKLSARDDVIRLTPRFMYFLLSRAKRTVSLDAKAQRLLMAASAHLSEQERAGIKRRVESGDWPLEDAMTLD